MDTNPSVALVGNWFLLASALAGLIQFVRKNDRVRAALWARIPEGYRWVVPVVLGAMAAFVESLAQGEEWRRALVTALAGAFGVGAGSMGLAAALRESPIPWDGRSGGKALEAAPLTPRVPPSPELLSEPPPSAGEPVLEEPTSAVKKA